MELPCGLLWGLGQEGTQPVPFSLHPISTTPALRGAWASIHVVNTVLTSELCPSPLETPQVRWPVHTGQCYWLSKQAAWADNSGIF